MARFTITTLGCKVNQCESDAIARVLEKGAFIPIKKGEKGQADYVIINTCTVTHKASMQSRQAIRQARRNHPQARIIVTGCYAQTESDEIAKIEGVDAIVGHGDKQAIPVLIQESMAGTRDLSGLPDRPRPVAKAKKFSALDTTAFGTRSRPFLKIQDGCNAFCSYCIVPHARGRSRSMVIEDVMGHLSRLGSAGFGEVVLTGIHIGAYGQDLSPATDLHALLTEIVVHKPVARVRISSIEPKELSTAIIDLTVASTGICDHFHIPLQSGDDDILKRMGRPYDSDLFRDVVQKSHARIPHAALGADVLIGFPGESDAAFENTYALVESLPLTYLHVFPFSPRKGTPAFDFTDRVADGVVKERCRRMRLLGQEKRLAFYARALGTRMQVLVEHRRDRKSHHLKGISGNYVPVLVAGPDELGGQLVDVEIEAVDGERVFGRLI